MSASSAKKPPSLPTKDGVLQRVANNRRRRERAISLTLSLVNYRPSLEVVGRSKRRWAEAKNEL